MDLGDLAKLGLPAEMVAHVDQGYEVARAAIEEAVEEARRVLQARGPATAAAVLSVAHVERSGGDPYQLAGALGVVLVELARRDSGEVS